MDSSVIGSEDSSAISYILDQEEHTIKFAEDATLQQVKTDLEDGTYTEVRFDNCAPIPVQALCDIIPSVNKNLKSLIICDTPWITDECIELFTAFCQKLYKIELCGNLVQITRSGIESISRNCGSLLSLSIVNSMDSQTDKFNKKQWLLDNRIFPALINNMNSTLKHFALSGFDTLTTDALEKFLLYFKRTLQSIDFSKLDIVNDSVLKCIGDNCNRLFFVKLNHCQNITDQSISLMVKTNCNIEVLELSGCEQLTDLSCDFISKSCAKLAIIKLDFCHKLTDKALQFLANHCKRLSYISMEGTKIRVIPYCVGTLKYLNFLNVNNCDELFFPPLEVLLKGIVAIQSMLREHDVLHQVRCMALGSSQSGKSSILFALRGEQAMNNIDGETFDVPVHRWYPFGMDSFNVLPKFNDSSSLSFELWDCTGRQAMEGVHGFFMNRRSIYIICFNLAVYNSADKVAKWLSTIQAKSPGCSVIIVASHSDLSTEQKTQKNCERVMDKLKEQEENQVSEIREELLFLRDLGLFAMIGSKRRKLEWLLKNRPVIHPVVIPVSSITGEGIDELRNTLLSIALEHERYAPVASSNDLESLLIEISNKKKKGHVMMNWSELILTMESYDINFANLLNLVKELDKLGIIMCLNTSNSVSNAVNQSNEEYPGESQLICINPPLLAGAIASLHRNESNAQDLVNMLLRGGHIDTVWTGNKPNDWTLRSTFGNITTNGLIRECVIPVLLYKLKISDPEQFKLIIDAIKRLFILIDGAPNASYDVELIVPNMKNLSVFKRYFLPFQGLLPIIPQVNAWQPKCPPTHIQVGWNYRFVGLIPPQLFLVLISACTVVHGTSEILSYWQSGTYIRFGDTDVSVCQWKDKLVLQVLARTKIVVGTRQAVNRSWCCLTKYFYTIEMILASFPGLYYEVLSVTSSHCKPVLEVIDEFEAGDVNEADVLWFIPLKGSTRSSIKSASLSPNYFTWLKSIYNQNKVYLSHSSELTHEVKPIQHYLQTSGYEIVAHKNTLTAIEQSHLIICILSSSYFEEEHLVIIKNNIKDQKIILAIFATNILIENHGHEDILVNKPRVNINGGSGKGSSYKAEPSELKSLVEVCHDIVFGHGSLSEELKRPSLAATAFSNAGFNSKSTSSKPFEQFSDIIKQYSNMSAEVEIKQVAATAVAAAVAIATAEHIAKQSNPTMGAKAAAMAAEVADAVAKGDSERAAKAVIATAKSVDEVVAFSNVRQSVSTKPNGVKSKEVRQNVPRSSMCVIV